MQDVMQDQGSLSAPASGEDPAEALELQDTLAKLQRYGKAIDAHWAPWLTEAEECFNFVAGHQWAQADMDRMKTEGKIPVTFNRMGPVIDAVSGAEILGRQQVKYSPRTPGDVQVNEVITQAAEWVRDQCDAGGEESDAFRDCFICGLGYTETRTDYEENPKGKIIIEGGPAMKCLPDPNARKPNAIDARYLRYRNEMSLDEFEELYPDEAPNLSDPQSGMKKTSNSPRDDYDKDGKKKGQDTVSVDLWQWYETRKVYLVPSTDGQGVVEYPAEIFEQLQAAAKEAGRDLPYATRNERVYFEAVLCGERWLEKPKQLRNRTFRFKFVTGKRDKTQGVWYGLARPMKDPQKWANAFFSMVLHIIRTNAKGGLIMERGAEGGESEDPIRDQKAFEETFAKSDEITWVAPGALSEQRIKPKPAPQIPAALAQLFQQSVDAIRDTSGVSQEMMGLVEANQPGVLEHQRKQASFAILAAFFDSFRRYRKFQGELLLRMMKDLPPETLIRIVADDDKEKYVPLALGFRQDQGVEDYDIIVDEAPAGPNQKDKTWALLTQIMPAVKELMTPELWIAALRFSPLPSAFVEKVASIINKAPDDQKAQMMDQFRMAMMQMQGQKLQADIRETNASASIKEVKAQTAATFPDPSPQVAA